MKISDALRAKIDSLDKARPYVWRLGLTEADFQELEDGLKESVAAHDGSCTHLLCPDQAMMVVVYLAEWYKRRYQHGETSCALHLNTDDLKALWQAAGFNQRVLLYRDEQGNRRWLYSIYVLGGLAVRHELNRPDRARFMRGLCRIYHGENYTLENLDDAGRAAAFRESIRRKHSLYEYMREMLSGAFDDSDDKELQQLVSAMKSANDEVLRQKFRLEWLVSYRPKDAMLHRSLRLWLYPEEIGGGLHHYLSYDRLRLWGIASPDSVASLRIALGFYQDDREVGAPCWDHPLIVFSKAGSAENGFVAWGVERSVTLRHIPTSSFNKIIIYAKTDDDSTYIADKETVTDHLQLWQTDAQELWSSRLNAQRATALLFSPVCHLNIGAASQGQIHLLPFVDGNGRSEEWGWFYIYDNVALVDGKSKEHVYYNRNGYDQVYTRRYEDTIAYIDGGLIRHCYEDEDGEDDELLPLIFSSHDVLVRHFDTKDAITDARVSMEGEAKQVEWKQPNGLYAAWTKTDQPPFGRVGLRVTIKGQQRLLTVAYLPSLGGGRPVVRDFEHQQIYSVAMDGTPSVWLDEIAQDGTPLEATIDIMLGVSSDYYVLPVYRPTLQKEICIGGKVVSYGEGTVVLPYILKQEATLRDFSEEGFRSYNCKQLTGFYLSIKQHISLYDFWDKGYAMQALEFDHTAPECLQVAIGAPEDPMPKGLQFLQWDYDKDREPWAVNYATEPERNTIIFQSMEQLDLGLVCVPTKRYFFPPFYQRNVAGKMSLLCCFETAVRHRLYFFVLEPIMQEEKKKDPQRWRTEIYDPLIAKRNGKLTEADTMGLQRLAEEMNFDWTALGVEI